MPESQSLMVFWHLLKRFGIVFASVQQFKMLKFSNIFCFFLLDFKQLRWEAERDKWIHNKDVKSIIRQKKKFKNKKFTNKGKKTRK